MFCGSVQCAFHPCDRILEYKEQTKSSRITRIVAAALGVSSITIGILVLAGVPGLCSLTSVGGGIFLGAGFITCCLAGCIECTTPGQQGTAGDTSGAPKVRRIRTSGGNLRSSGTRDGIRFSIESVMSKKFLAHQNYTHLVEEFKWKHGIEDLEARLLDNYGTTDVDLAIPILVEGGELREDLIQTFLSLMFSTTDELLNLPAEEVKDWVEDGHKQADYGNDFRNLLTLRLMEISLKEQTEYAEGTLGYIFGGDLRQIPRELYLYCPADLTERILRNEISQQIVWGFFPGNIVYHPFIWRKIIRVIRELPADVLNECVPFLPADRVKTVFMYRRQDLDFTNLTDYQVKTLFGNEENTTNLHLLSIAQLNAILPKMTSIRLLSLPQLDHSGLDLRAQDPEHIKKLFRQAETQIDHLSDENRRFVQNVVRVSPDV